MQRADTYNDTVVRRFALMTIVWGIVALRSRLLDVAGRRNPRFGHPGGNHDGGLWRRHNPCRPGTVAGGGARQPMARRSTDPTLPRPTDSARRRGQRRRSHHTQRDQRWLATGAPTSPSLAHVDQTVLLCLKQADPLHSGETA